MELEVLLWKVKILIVDIKFKIKFDIINVVSEKIYYGVGRFYKFYSVRYFEFLGLISIGLVWIVNINFLVCIVWKFLMFEFFENMIIYYCIYYS